MKVLVLDLTHGGDILVREYLRRGCDVTAVDIYYNSSSICQGLQGLGVRCLPASPAERFDLVVMPVHAPDRYLGEATASRRITHHQAVGELAHFPFPTVEITGSKGKTSTCHMLSYLLSRKGLRTLALTSSGLLEYGTGVKVLEDKVSIAPATLLRISKEYCGYDIGVLEVSLGGSGLAQVGVITGLQDDYPIAAGTRRAVQGKAQMIANAKHNVVFPADEGDIWKGIVPPNVGAVTFGEGGDVQVELELGPLGSGSELLVKADDTKVRCELNGRYLHTAYRTAFACSLATMKALGHDIPEAVRSLPDFSGVNGRGEIHQGANGILIKERNPGVSASSLNFLLNTLVNEYGCRDIGIFLDPINRKVCEKLDLGAVQRSCSRMPEVKGLYLSPSGKGMEGDDMQSIDSVGQLSGKHEVLIWAVKEGYI